MRLIKKKPLPVNAAEELTSYREEQIKALDDRISQAIFGGLTDDQDRELNNLLDRGEPSSETLESFFYSCTNITGNIPEKLFSPCKKLKKVTVSKDENTKNRILEKLKCVGEWEESEDNGKVILTKKQ